ncbi:hypothetical protein A5724_00285 [Mycobacterium sp. ACS1612]|uniref:hypothetical protein n=1 Tax=Mycobacterium sp. ACS1612 TaxID=1834117 RepID=UPI0007FF0682|nr:hypothetical protein [Mycobacterium sp. ACS1612]OBF42209.1 hypothetical protein A5724_00285 [Mycobacterium sp. ACS1612]
MTTRRVALAAFGTLAVAGVLGLEFARRSAVPQAQLADGPGGEMMGVDPADMRTYMEMFSRHAEINRVVEEIPGGVRTTTESTSPDLVARLQAHVSAMYSRLGNGTEVMCMSQSLPTLFRAADEYRRQLTLIPTGVIAEETAEDPVIIRAIREHAREVTGFVRDGMPAIMGPMMGSGGMMVPR